MAPNFLSKLVKPSQSARSREASVSLESPRSRSPSPPATNRQRLVSLLTSHSPTSSTSSPSLGHSKGQSVEAGNTSTNNLTITGSDTSDSTNPSVTVIPPSPHESTMPLDRDAPADTQRTAQRTAEGNGDVAPRSSAEGRNVSGRTMSYEDDLPTPTAQHPLPPPAKALSPLAPRARPLTPASSTGDLREFVNHHTGSSPPVPAPAAPPQPPAMRRTPSDKSLTISVHHVRAATVPAPDTGSILDTLAIVESPTSATNSPEILPRRAATVVAASASTLLPPPRDADAVSISSATKKKKPWRRGSTNRKPTGLASAIAASGLAMVNPALAAPPHALPGAAAPGGKAGSQSKLSLSPPRSPPGSSAALHSRQGSLEVARHARRSGSISKRAEPRTRARTASSAYSEAQSSEYVDENGNYSGLEEESYYDESESEDDLMDLDLGEEDIPVTGFAVASSKRNADFHELFPTIPEGDYLIEDYGCALQREILIQGRIYISENHICFHANIFGWITNLSIPIYEITHLEKKMTAFVIPNAIQITTRQAKYAFASFLSRDTTFDVIFNIWRLARPEDTSSMISGSPRESLEGGRVGMDRLRDGGAVLPTGAPKALMPPKVTQCACGKEGKHYSETALEIVVPGTPDRIHNLIFASGFMKDFLKVNQKLMDLQISDWTPIGTDSKLLTRNMSYIKPLSGSLGPKQTKCEIKDETLYCDFDDYVVTLTTTRTPDVPSGSVFSVKTRTCIMWASAVSTKVLVTTQVEWTGRSFIRGIIEKSAIDGQKVYHSELEKAMRAYIKEHQSEFMPEGVDLAALPPPELLAPGPSDAAVGATGTEETSMEEARKKREHERNQRGLQWAWDTFEGAAAVARRSTTGALELIRDGWEQSSATTILWFVIVGLVFSNLWTLMRMGAKEESGRRKERGRLEEREKWVQGVVAALRDEMVVGGVIPAIPPAGTLPRAAPPPAPPGTVNWREEVAAIQRTLEDVEKRVQSIRNSLPPLEGLGSLD